jgi:hypothetical protein
MVALVENIHSTLKPFLRPITKEAATELIEAELSSNLVAKTLADATLEFGDPYDLWLARWTEGPLDGEIGLLAGVNQDETAFSTYLHLRLRPKDYVVPYSGGVNEVRTCTFMVVHDPVTAVLTVGIDAYRGPNTRILLNYRGIDEVTTDDQNRASLIKLPPERFPTSWHEELGIKMEERHIREVYKQMPITLFWPDLHFPS